VWTHNLAIGVGLGVLTAMVLFARRVAHLATVDRRIEQHFGDEIAKYEVKGELFFASSNDLYTQFNYAEDPEHVVIDMYNSHVWDASTVASLDAITEKYAKYGKRVEISGLNTASAALHERMAGNLGAGH
jgi:SulP family sulfate permease